VSHWNYRLVRQLVDDEVMVALHEVYYDDQDKVTGWTAEPTTIRGDDYWEVADALTKAGGAISYPVLDVTEEPWVWRKPGSKAEVLGPAK